MAANTNPIVLDAMGDAVVFLTEGVTYTFELRDSAGVLMWTQDGITSSGSDTGLPVYTSPPTTDVGSPIYINGIGWSNWNGVAYVSDYAAGFTSGAYSWRNKIINGDFRIWQDGTSVGPITSASSNPYTADQWRIFAEGTASVTVAQQAAGADFGQGRVGGFTARITSNAASTPGAANRNSFIQSIEGQGLLDLALGSLWGGYFTVSFWVKASIAGAYSMAILNGGTPTTRSYVKNYNVSVAGAWEKKVLAIPIDQGGIANWDRSTGIGMQLIFDLGSGTNFEGAVDTWLSTATTRSTGSVRMVGTNGATIEIGQVQLEPGSQETPFGGRPMATEFSLCQRYYETSGGQFAYTNPGNNATVAQYLPTLFTTTKRAPPTMLISQVNGTITAATVTARFVNWQFPNAGSVNNVWSWVANARL
ncbi:hypothetical protein D3C71_1212280 [compost metagenome]